MNAEIVNNFLNATVNLLRDHYQLEVEGCAAPSLIRMPMQLNQVTVILSFTGDLFGQFVLGLPRKVSLELTRAMLGNPHYEEFDEFCQSAIGELGNMICGMTAAELAEMGLRCDFAPPMVIVSQQASMNFGMPGLTAQPLMTDAGELSIYVGMSQAVPALARPASTSV